MLLPQGVAVVRVQTPQGRVVLVSETLTNEQAVAAKVLAAIMSSGRSYVMLSKADVIAALQAAA